MFDIHIEEFYQDSAKVLLQIYHAFPRRVSVFVEDISGDDQPDEYGIHSDRHQATFGAMLWLAQENYITYEDTIRKEALDQAVLTSKALTMLASACIDENLCALLDSVQAGHNLQGRPHAEAVRFLMRHGTSSQLARGMQLLLSLS